MNRFRYLNLFAVACISALAVAGPAQALSDFRSSHAQASAPPPATSEPRAPFEKGGFANFKQSHKYLLSTNTRATVSSTPPQPQAPSEKGGFANFRLSHEHLLAATTNTQQAQPSPQPRPREGFNWDKAGIDAGALLALSLLVGGVGAGILLVRNRRRELRGV
jgi:hypothetical protein